MISRTIRIGNKQYQVTGDKEYLGDMPDIFEPATISIINTLQPIGSLAVDIGANIGLTSIRIAENAYPSVLIAVEPVKQAYACLVKNLVSASIKNAETHNVAMGDHNGSVSLYVNENNNATSFVSETSDSDNLTTTMTTLDSLLTAEQAGSVGFMKIDVEGFELSVLGGCKNVLDKSRPIVMLEMNHWCLNVFRRISIPDFHEKLLDIFPALFAVDEEEIVDFTEKGHFGYVYEQHILKGRFMNLVAGFEKKEIMQKLKGIHLF